MEMEHQGLRGGVCPPTPSVLNIGQFLTDQEVEGGMGEPHWFVAYSHVLQRVGEATCRRKWDMRQEALEIKASPLVCAFWCETDIDLTMVGIKCCWEPTPRTLHHKRACSHHLLPRQAGCSPPHQ